MRKRFIPLLLFILHFSLFVSASPRLNDLDIRVVLSKNGDATITETRHMDIDSEEGTECYIVIGNLNGSTLGNLSVSDETGLEYRNIGAWDIDRSRDEKAGQCGIVARRDGYELCWGLGQPGQRTYSTRYTISQLVKGYSDADGFNYMFVAEGLKPSPAHVKLTITTADTTAITDAVADIWAFRYEGTVDFAGGDIVAESTEPFRSHSAMIVMARFDKGLFTPTATVNESFEDVKTRAFEGSDYDDDESIWPLVILIAFIILSCGLSFLLYFIYIWWQRRKILKDLIWYRDKPYNGNLQAANNVLNAYSYGAANYNNLLSAYILQLINLGAITIETRLNKKGKSEQNFVIHELKDSGRQPLLLRKVHDIFRKAAGDDTILEPRELSSWMKSTYNQSATDSFVQTLHTKTNIYQYKHELDDVRKVFGLKKFLKEFSLLDERSVGELSLWKDYMVYATLFGIADQVIRDMKKINPEYFNMDKVAQQMADDMTIPLIYSTMHRSTARAAMSKAEREARASGSGGHASWGGGGGFSGGGFGGGVR